MKKDIFKKERIKKSHPKYKTAVWRKSKLYPRPSDIRSPFARDYTRILHCFGFRRLKHKTQVFFAPENDHICTRLEHALHVASISATISKQLGLNTELVTAIAIGHDLGHAPFGHYGEGVLDDIWRVNIQEIKKKNKGEKCKYFWHEKHSLRAVDYFETVKDDKGYQQNLKLTYAVRDGIICHCGESKFQKPMFPRNDKCDLEKISKPGELSPYTWEGCVVKISDMISYLGRDLEDAEISDLIDDSDLCGLKKSINKQIKKIKIKDMCNSALIHTLIIDLCKNSNPKNGMNFSEDGKEIISQVYGFNSDKIYFNEELKPYKNYIRVNLETIFNDLKKQYDKDIVCCVKNMKKKKETIYQTFLRTWLERYHKEFNSSYTYLSEKNFTRKEIKRIYNIKSEKEYYEAIIDYMAGFTDNFANRCFNEIISVI